MFNPLEFHLFNVSHPFGVQRSFLKISRKRPHPGYTFLPTPDEWEKVGKVCEFLEVFNEVTNISSRSDYPTSNLFFTEVWKIKEVINERLVDNNDYIKSMALRMSVKFEKYWDEFNLLMAIGAFLDLRYKMMLIDYAFYEVYPEEEVSYNVGVIKDAAFELYNEYALNHVTSNIESSTQLSAQQVGSSSTTSHGKISGQSKYESYVAS